MKQEHSSFSRRKFIGSTATAIAGISILPSNVVAGLGHKAPSDKLNVAGIGVGGIGYQNLKHIETENIVALCDVDWKYANRNSFREWPVVPQYKDYRDMFDKQKDIDAVVIATPDHSHALPAMMAMRQGIHVYLQQPLSHTIYESRVLAEAADTYNVATQMGNQGSSGDGVRQICEWLWAGTIGNIKHVDAWTNRPTWPQALEAPRKDMRIPKTLDWDLFIGPAAYRPYNEAYHPWGWRRWWEFGSGALGDMGSHILDPVFKALKLQYPTSVQSSSTEFTIDSPPNSEMITFEFPARDNLPKLAMPPVTVNWYDGGMLPTRPDELKDGELMGNEDGGCIFYGTKGKLMCGAFGEKPTLLPTSEMANFDPPQKSIRRIPDALDGGHERDWVRACKETPKNRVEASSNFAFAGPMNETIMLGALAIRLQSLGRKLKWDGPNMRFTNISNRDQLKIMKNSSFEVVDGDPRTSKEFTHLEAEQAIDNWIRLTYRQGWEQI